MTLLAIPHAWSLLAEINGGLDLGSDGSAFGISANA